MLNVSRWIACSFAVIVLAGVCAIAQTTTPPPAPAIPAVVLSEQHQELCVVKVGDAFPTLALTTLDGAEQPLPDMYGKRATVILFWHGNGWSTRAALRDLGPDIAEPLQKQGVTVISIAVNQPADATQAALEMSESKLTTLLDPEGKAFAQVGSEILPRVYLIDAAGKIVWFDLGYSHSTRRELKQAVEALAEK
jgi:hypothetical protein